jgi:hypothetical protein
VMGIHAAASTSALVPRCLLDNVAAACELAMAQTSGCTDTSGTL